ncbi:MAG: flagellar biosynthesis protein FlhA [Sandaracinaceae bacterium]
MRPRVSAEILLASAVVLVVALMVVPLPTVLLDLLLATNLSVAVLLLVVAFFVRDPVSFGAFPTVLLLTTLFRLALNVSSTRLILLQADAGQVIEAFGRFVVQGSLIVGAVVFAILTLVQFVVIARGAERVAEVGARFTLDAMPGKQLAIDADLRSGLLDARAAGERRQELEREGQLYGAMDGAMKFVRGDAIAGLAITAINLVGGVTIGVAVHGIDLTGSLQRYGLLTIGDGLVTQLPALLISTAAGLVVTRVASAEADGSLGHDLARELLGDPRPLAVAAGFAALLAAVPGLPMAPFASLAVARAAGAVVQARRAPVAEPVDPPRATPVEVRVGPALGRRLARSGRRTGPPWLGLGSAPRPDHALSEALVEVRRRLHRDLGLPVPVLSPIVDPELASEGYRITVRGARAQEGVGSPGAEPARDLAARVEAVLRDRPEDAVGLQEVRALLDRLAADAPALVRGIVPGRIDEAALARLLRALLAEGVSIAPLREVLEAVAEGPPEEGHAARLGRVRRALGAVLLEDLSPGGELTLHPLDPLLEETLRDHRDASGDLAAPPSLLEDVVEAIGRAVGQAARPVLVTRRDLRAALASLLRPRMPDVVVLAYDELPPHAQVKLGRTVEP